MPTFLRWLAYAVFALTVIPAGLALAEIAKARRAAYYAVRRAALRRGTRWLLVAIVLPVVGAVLLLLGRHIPATLPTRAPTATLLPTPTATDTLTPTIPPTATPTATRRPTATAPRVPTATPTRRPTATAPPIPSCTPTVLPPAIALTPIPSSVPARVDARIELLALAMQADRNGQPVEPGKEFPPGQHPVYLFFQYEGMDPGVPVTVAWYRDGELMDICTEAWLWDLVEDRVWGEEGKAAVSCQPISGWAPGSHEIRLFLATELQGVAQFAIQ